MKCPKPDCEHELIWQSDNDLDEGQHCDDDGEPFIIESFWECSNPKCKTQVLFFD